ncbi:MAG: phage terminase small subunit P27 family [Pseudoruegeria sp.]
MKGAKPQLNNVVPMAGDAKRPVPDAPDWMSSGGREVWDELAATLISKDRLQSHHTQMFAAYCEAVSDFIEQTGNLAMTGQFYEVETRNGNQEKKRASWGLRQDALANMRQLSALFGFSPVDEARLSTGGQGDLFKQVMDHLNGPD